MVSRRKPIRAEDLLKELRADPAWVREERESRRRRLAAEMEYRREEQPLLAALRDAGVYIESVWDLVNTRKPYPNALPILVEQLSRPYSEVIREGIIRALSVAAAARVASRPLIETFRREPADNIRWVIGNALAYAADPADAQDIVDLFKDRSYGGARDRLALALARLLGAEAIPLLLVHLDDPDVAGEVIHALGELRAREAKPLITAFLKHPDSYLREQARKALKKIDRKASR